MKRLLLSTVGAAATLAAPLAYGDVIYQNDFSTRTSTGAIPYGEWREVSYSTGAFLNSDYNAPFTGNVFQDNWIRGRNKCDCPCQIVYDNGNPEVIAYNADTNNNHVIVKHRIGNTFTNGIVTAQCDLRAPITWWRTSGSPFQGLVLGDERYFSPDTDTTAGSEYLNYRCAEAGVFHDSGIRKFYTLESSGRVKENTTLANTTSWYRVVLTVNLDTRKWSGAFYDLGTSHPTLDTPTPETAVFSKSDIDMPFAAVTSISALGLCCYSPHGGSDPASLDLSKTGQFDNLCISHNGTECYVNDFASRRSRGLYGTVAAEYVTESLVTNSVGTEVYVAGSALYPASNSIKTNSQPVGVDGWRRINSNLLHTPTVYSDGSDTNPAMRFINKSGEIVADVKGVAAVTIGQTLTNGTVRASVDVRATGIGGSTTDQGVQFHIGSDDLYTANDQQYSNRAGRYGSVGIVGTTTKVDDATYRRPFYVTPAGAKVYGTGDEWVKQGTWLRFTIEANLDAGTYAVTIRDQGTDHPLGDAADGETIYYSKSGLDRITSSVDSISSVYLAAIRSTVKFDNLRIWHRPTGAVSETLVYDNRFHSRTIYYQDMRESRLVGLLSKEPVGQDGWTRANIGTLKAVVRDNGGNPSLTFGDGKDTLVYALHDIGMSHKSGKLTTQVDACPPSGWRGANRSTYFWLGGDKFHEGNLKNNDEAFFNWAALSFGFRDAAGTTGAGGVYTNVTLCAYNGNGTGSGSLVYSNVAVDPTHWYRFVVKTSLDDGTSDIAVYDMGTEHPTFASERPAAPVATFAGMRFRRAEANLGGVSSLGVSAMGTMDNPINEKTGAYWDNICISSQRGFVLIVR